MQAFLSARAELACSATVASAEALEALSAKGFPKIKTPSGSPGTKLRRSEIFFPPPPADEQSWVRGDGRASHLLHVLGDRARHGTALHAPLSLTKRW